MTKQALKDIEKLIDLQDEILDEYKRLNEKNTMALLNNTSLTSEEKGELKVLYHLVDMIIK